MPSAGTVTLNLDANSVKMIRELQKAQRQTKRTSNQMARNMSRAFGRMGKAAAVFGTALAGALTTKVVRATIEQQKAVAQLNASLQSTGRYSKTASDALQAHAAALQQVSTYGDEAIIGAQSLLLTFKGLGDDVLPRTTQAVVDMSAKMGMDLKSSAIQLGKALNDPATGLSMLTRVGITFSDEQKNVIKALQKTGDLAGAQAVILEELESQFAGSAKAARDTLGGALQAVANNFGDLLEVSGDDSTGVVGSLNELADILADPSIRDGFQTLAAGALEFLGSLAQLPAAVIYLKDELKQLFGVVDEGDFVRRDEEILELEAQLIDAKEAANAWWRTEDNIYKARAISLEREIALKKASLQADRDLAGLAQSQARPESSPSRGMFGAPPEAPDAPPPISLKPNKVKEEADRIADIIADLTNDVRTFGMTDDEKALINIIDEGATEEQIALVKQLQEELRLLTHAEEVANAELTEVVMTAERYERKVEEVTNESMDALARSGVSAFDSFINGAESAQDAAKNLIKEIGLLIIKQAILAALGGGGGANGGFSFAAAFGGGRAGGGDIRPNTAYLVGEKGPEIIIPKTAGNVIPNHQLGVAGGGNITNIVNLPPTVQRQTAQQVASEVSRIQKRASSRNK